MALRDVFRKLSTVTNRLGRVTNALPELTHQGPVSISGNQFSVMEVFQVFGRLALCQWDLFWPPGEKAIEND